MPALVWPPVAGSADDAEPKGPIEPEGEGEEEEDSLFVSTDP